MTDRGFDKYVLCRRIIFTALAVLWMVLIFSFSAQESEKSSGMSHRVGRKAGELLVPGFSQWPEEKQASFAATIDYPLRKCAHMTEYAVLSVLLFLMLASYGIPLKKRVLLAFILAVLYAASDEIHQLYVPGRSGQFKDVLIDSVGILAGCAGSAWLALCRRRV